MYTMKLKVDYWLDNLMYIRRVYWVSVDTLKSFLAQLFHFFHNKIILQ